MLIDLPVYDPVFNKMITSCQLAQPDFFFLFFSKKFLQSILKTTYLKEMTAPLNALSVALCAIAMLCASMTLVAAQLPDNIRAEDISRAQRNVFASMTKEEKVMLIRCQLCHDVLDSVKAYVATPELIVGQRGADIAPKACGLVSAALSEGGIIYAQRGADYAGAAMKLVEETCGLLMDDIAQPYADYIDTLLDGAVPSSIPCDLVCPGAEAKQKQTERMTEALKTIKAADANRERERAEGRTTGGGDRRTASASASESSSLVSDVLLIGSLSVVAWLSLKAYRLAAASNSGGGKKTTRRK
jgi:hypothetical protein